MSYSLFVSGFPSGFGSAFFQFALERLASFGSYAWNEGRMIWNVHDELVKLQKTMADVQVLVDDVDCCPLRLIRGNEVWKKWFVEMKKLTYDADSLVDHIFLLASTSGEVRNMILTSPFTVFIPHKVNALQNNLEKLARDMKNLHGIEKMRGSGSNIWSTSWLIDATTVVGRAMDKQRCLDDLVGETTNGNFSVISLVGMAGIGKTTVAQLVYGDITLNGRFEKKIWVHVSTKFDVIKVLKSIFEELTEESCTSTNLNSVQSLVQTSISGLKFLLVLDDYWSEEYADWNNLSLPLSFGSKGSKVIVTTRSAKVSTTIKSSQTYNLEHLSDDECWDLMKQRIPKELESLEPIGREIARKCKGLPLAAKTVGSVLSNSRCNQNDWRCTLKSKLWDLPLDKNDIFPSLMRSYIHLSPQQQKCFAYCSLFPKDHEFEVEELVLLWMAEGFIQPIEGWRLEDLGQQYFYDLCSRSFFKEVTNSMNPSRYKMHDLIHDMAQLVSDEICFQMNMSDSYPLFMDTCHLSMLLNSMNIHLKASQKNERLRTFLIINNRRAEEGQLSIDLFMHLQFLRVLDLSRIGLTELTNAIDCLRCLRYLNLSENQISKLPKAICNLVALQTLKLKDCKKIHELPDDIKNLSSLRHLDFDIKAQLSRMPPDFGKLTNLQSLSAFVVGKKIENGIAQLRDMDSLRGSFCITNLYLVKEAKDADEALLHKKEFLEKLELQWVPSTSNDQTTRQSSQGVVLSRLKPHENLEELVIHNYCGRFYPDWLCEQNRKLTSIHLQGLKYCNQLPPLGQLLLLKSFYISDMPCLVLMNDNFYGTGDGVKFPSLELFEVRSMSGLKGWEYTGNVVAMPRLRNFTIADCPVLRSIPADLRHHPGSRISECPAMPLS